MNERPSPVFSAMMSADFASQVDAARMIPAAPASCSHSSTSSSPTVVSSNGSDIRARGRSFYAAWSSGGGPVERRTRISLRSRRSSEDRHLPVRDRVEARVEKVEEAIRGRSELAVAVVVVVGAGRGPAVLHRLGAGCGDYVAAPTEPSGRACGPPAREEGRCGCTDRRSDGAASGTPAPRRARHRASPPGCRARRPRTARRGRPAGRARAGTCGRAASSPCARSRAP